MSNTRKVPGRRIPEVEMYKERPMMETPPHRFGKRPSRFEGQVCDCGFHECECLEGWIGAGDSGIGGYPGYTHRETGAVIWHKHIRSSKYGPWQYARSGSLSVETQYTAPEGTRMNGAMTLALALPPEEKKEEPVTNATLLSLAKQRIDDLRRHREMTIEGLQLPDGWSHYKETPSWVSVCYRHESGPIVWVNKNETFYRYALKEMDVGRREPRVALREEVMANALSWYEEEYQAWQQANEHECRTRKAFTKMLKES